MTAIAEISRIGGAALQRSICAIVLAVMYGGSFANPAAAQLTIQQYETLMNMPDKTREENIGAVELYFEGLAGGIHWMAGEYVNEHKAGPLFCWRPGDLPRLADYANLIDRELKERPQRWSNPNQPVSQVAVEALRRHLPCR